MKNKFDATGYGEIKPSEYTNQLAAYNKFITANPTLVDCHIAKQWRAKLKLGT